LVIEQSGSMSPRAPALAAILTGLCALAAPLPARADNGPVIVIPSRPGVPVIIHGYDASYAVVEGDWGLARPGHGAVTVIGGHPLRPNHVYSPRNSYHPRYGRAPARGRNEVEPPPDQPLPDPPESFSRSWSTSSEFLPVADAPQALRYRAQPQEPSGGDPLPATINDPQPYSPPIVVVPRIRRP
jgi:hypothetical protein